MKNSDGILAVARMAYPENEPSVGREWVQP